MSVAETFIDRIQGHAGTGLAICDEAEKRGHFTVDELRELDRLEVSELPKWMCAYEIAAERDGVSPRARRHMIPDVLARKGLHIENDRKGTPKIHVYGGIGDAYGGITAEDFRTRLDQIDPHKQIELHVHSDGGSFTDGVAIHNSIKDRPGRTLGFVDGLAASAGSLLLMSCYSITMATASKMMIHYASVGRDGSWSEEDLERALELMRETNADLIRLYMPRWKGTEKELDRALRKETYYNATEAVRVGLADYVSDSVQRASYAAVTGYGNPAGFSIAASAGAHKRFNTRRAALKLWQIEADDMRRELTGKY